MIKNQIGINAGAVYHWTDALHFAVDYFRAELNWQLGEQQVIHAIREMESLIEDGYRWLRRLAEDRIGADDSELWQDWERIEGKLMAMGPALRHLDYLEAEVRRLSGGRLRRAAAKLLQR